MNQIEISLLDNQQFNYTCHCPQTCLDEEGNRLFMVFYGGEPEGSNGCGIWMSIHNLETNRWDLARRVAYDPDRCFQNPVIHYQNQILYLFYTSQDGIGWGDCQKYSSIKRKISHDLGETWTEPETIIPEGLGCYLRHKIIISKKDPNVWLMPVYFTPDGELTFQNQCSEVYQSKDCGKTWTSRSGKIKGSGDAIGTQGTLDYVGDRLVMIFRNRHMDEIFYSYSDDDGFTFTELEPIDSSLYSNNSGLGATVINNQIYLVLNDNRTSGSPRRHPLSLVVMEFDNQISQKGTQKLKILKRENIYKDRTRLLSYPVVVYDQPRNRLIINFTYRRLTIGHVNYNL